MYGIKDMCVAGCTSERGVRLWETLGLLGEVERTSGDQRRYTDEQLERAKIIAAAQFGGWKLDEIGEMIGEYHASLAAYEALTTRLSDQIRAAIRLGENLPRPLCANAKAQEYDL